MGHIPYLAEGLKPDPEKVNAVLEMVKSQKMSKGCDISVKICATPFRSE